jgi:hypothetical protein
MKTKVVVPSLASPSNALGPRHARWRWVLASLLGVPACGGTDFTTSPDGDGSGGTSASGGSGTGGSDGCAEGPLTFRLETVEPERNCIPTGSCANSWITIRDMDGTVLRTSTDCEMTCGECESVDCPDIACVQAPFDRPLSFRFDGSYLVESTCGGGSECLETACAPAGQYVAEFCLERALPPPEGSTECTPAGTTECFELPFSWPEAGEATLVVGEEN